MSEHRGRPTESPAVIRDKYVQICHEIPSKPELGWTSTWHFDLSKSTNGAYKVENSPPKGYQHPKVKIEKGKSYGNHPVVMVFKSSDRSNAKTKMKVWHNENIDYIATAKKLPGVPDTSILLELGVGRSFIDLWKLKYKL
jgi:hypothetical protein